MKNDQRGFTHLVALAIVVCLCLVGVVGFRTFRSSKYKDNTVAQNTPVESSVSSSADEIPLDQLCANPTELNANSRCAFYNLPGGVASTDGQNSLVIPDLGIKLTVPDSIKGMTFEKVTASDSLHPKRITAVEVSLPQCHSLGIFNKVQGQSTAADVNGSDSSYGTLVKQYPDFFITYVSPQAACTEANTRQAAIQNANDVASLKNSLSTVSLSP